MKYDGLTQLPLKIKTGQIGSAWAGGDPCRNFWSKYYSCLWVRAVIGNRIPGHYWKCRRSTSSFTIWGEIDFVFEIAIKIAVIWCMICQHWRTLRILLSWPQSFCNWFQKLKVNNDFLSNTTYHWLHYDVINLFPTQHITFPIKHLISISPQWYEHQRSDFHRRAKELYREVKLVILVKFLGLKSRQFARFYYKLWFSSRFFQF